MLNSACKSSIIESAYNATYGLDITLERETGKPYVIEFNGLRHWLGNRSYHIYRDDRVQTEVNRRILNFAKEPYPPIIYHTEIAPYYENFKMQLFERRWVDHRIINYWNNLHFPDKYNNKDSEVGLIVGIFRHYEKFNRIDPQFVINPIEIEGSCLRKDLTYAILRHAGLHDVYPKTLLLPCSIDKLASFLDSIKSKTIIKKPVSGGNGRDISVYDKRSIHLSELANTRNFLIQEFIPCKLIQNRPAVARVSYTKGFVDAFWKMPPNELDEGEYCTDESKLIGSFNSYGGFVAEISDDDKTTMRDFCNQIMPIFENQILVMEIGKRLFTNRRLPMKETEVIKILEIMNSN